MFFEVFVRRHVSTNDQTQPLPAHETSLLCSSKSTHPTQQQKDCMEFLAQSNR